jgi:mono/diheme cytochrome c family protein
MGYKTGFVLGIAALVSVFAAPRAQAAASRKVDFNHDIRPMLSDNCFACHGPDEKKRKAKLRLDTSDGAVADLGKGVRAVVPGKPAESALWKRITTTNPDDLMPPAETHKKLTERQIALFKQWIEEGANFKSHWAFETPKRPAFPKTEGTAWVRNGIDHFILAKLEAQGLKPSPEASKETLVRRVTLDLTGLPPTADEVDAFLADTDPGAYERLVTRLLQSPRYGEHMGRYWLDAARYGDTHGLHLDNERSMWPYRDWVVRAFNRNQPFDQFTVEQLAGDLLPNASQDQLVASGFNRCNVTTGEGGSINEELLFRYAVDRTETTAAVWMGLTAGCAVCHDHKFDPISTREFYSMYAFFNSAADPAMDGNSLTTPPILKLAAPDQQKKLDDLGAKISAAEKKSAEVLAKLDYKDPATLTPPPPITQTETVWVDDDAPPGAQFKASPGAPTQWVTTGPGGKIVSGKRALKRSDKGLAQDFYESGAAPFNVPAKGKIFAHVYLEPADLPKTVMLQFHVGENWSHRAVWGDIDAIDWGKKGTVERKHMGPLPKAGEWVKLEFSAESLGLKAGTKVNGLAFTQFGGTVFWDKLGVSAESNPATDPTQSLAAWQKENQGKNPQELPQDVRNIFRSVKPEDRKPDQTKRLRDYYLENVCATTRSAFDAIRKDADKFKAERDQIEKVIPATFIYRDTERPRESFIMIRGQYNKPGERVYPSVPAIFPPMQKTESTNRLSLARWLVDPQHPLTARVAVNRFWQQFFGVGLVKTANDFGSQGEPPSHAELLDWLATGFMQDGWDVKRFVKAIVMSATYRQESKVTSAILSADPENRLLSHAPRFRLDGEAVRDGALFVSGLMNPAIGGKGVRPYQPENIWEPVAYSGSNTRVYKQDSGDALYRRSLYTFWKRTAPPPNMMTFDAPSRESFCVRRERSNTPLQALILMNDVQYFEAARAFAQRLIKAGGASESDRLAWAFRAVTARHPNALEQRILADALSAHLAKFKAEPDAAKQAITFGESKPAPELDPTELAAYTMVANMLLNLDEAVSKN